MRDPRDVLGLIPGFEQAAVAGRLSDGPTNDSYLVDHEGRRYVLRVDRPEAARLGLDRQAEKQVYEAVTAAGLGPVPVRFDVAEGVFLRPFLPGRSWAADDLRDPGNLQRLAVLLRRLHALPPAGNTFDPLAAAARYARQAGTDRARRLYREAADAFAAIAPAGTALCHNDLVCQNVLEGEALTLIDWEYAGVGDPFFDLAVVVQHHGLQSGLAAHILDAYLGREANPSDRERLQTQCRFYQALLDLWNLRVAAPTNPGVCES